MFYDYYIKKSCSCVILLSVLLLAACTGNTQYHQVEFQSTTSKKYSPTNQLPKISSVPAEELIEKGYARIGQLTVWHKVEECFGEECTTKTFDVDPTAELLEEGAKHGGEFVILHTNNHKSETNVQKTGECLYKADEYRYSYVGGMQRFSVCQDREIIGGTAITHSSSGSLWKHDPALAREMGWGIPFLKAIENNDFAKVKDLIGKGADVNKFHKGPEVHGTPLGVAVKSGNLEMVKWLLSKGAMPQDKKLSHPVSGSGMYEAVYSGNIEILNELLSKRGQLPVNAVKIAIKNEKLRMEWLHHLVSLGVRVNEFDFLAFKYKEDRLTPEIAIFLIQRGADVNKQFVIFSELDRRRETTLLGHFTKMGNLEMMKVLLEHGADPTVGDYNAGEIALVYDQVESAKLLQIFGYDFIMDAQLASYTIAFKNCSVDMIQWLSEQGYYRQSYNYIKKRTWGKGPGRSKERCTSKNLKRALTLLEQHNIRTMASLKW